MADNIDVTPGSGAVVATDDVSGVQFQRVKLTVGDNGAADFAPGNASDGFYVKVTGVVGNVSVTPAAMATFPISAASAVPISDNSSSLTVDAPVATPVAVRLSDGADWLAGLPVSGTVTSAQGAAAANSAAWPIKISDGTNTVGITNLAGTKALKVDVIQSVADAASQDDASTLGNVTPVAGLYNDSPSDPSSGQAAAVRLTLKRGLHTNLRTAAGVEIGTAASPLYIAAATAPGTLVVSGTVDTNLNDSTGTPFSAANPLQVVQSSQARTRVTKYASITASQPATDLWIPTSKKFYIKDIFINCTVAGPLALFDQSNTAGNQVFVGTRQIGSYQIHFDEAWASSAINNILRWLTGTGIVADLVVHGYEE